MNLSNMNLAELRDLEEKTRHEIKKREIEEMVRAREEILSIAQKLGVPLKDILGVQVRAKSAKPAAVYQHPENAELSWSGRGRKPGWVKQWVDGGQPLEGLRSA
ncbi:MAG: H-NS histone family protein [Herminiimonas sp.]|nr:H-NS histone family protein [Herminiimonas sp.]